MKGRHPSRHRSLSIWVGQNRTEEHTPFHSVYLLRRNNKLYFIYYIYKITIYTGMYSTLYYKVNIMIVWKDGRKISISYFYRIYFCVRLNSILSRKIKIDLVKKNSRISSSVHILFIIYRTVNAL